MQRLYEATIQHHLDHYAQMIFLCGPRQVGKTTLLKIQKFNNPFFKYLNWDITKDREQILAGVEQITQGLPLDALLSQKPLLAFDEIHKYSRWKTFLKGFIDEYKETLQILVTGSSKLDVFRRGGDSLMGRYFLYHIHPLSVSELLRTTPPALLTSLPQKLEQEKFQALFEFGGFPEPFMKQEQTFSNRWQNLRNQQMFKEDIRDLAKIQELAQLEVLAFLLRQQVGQLVSYHNLANKVRVADTTIRRWINTLNSFYYCFTVKPWHTNVTRSLLKEPKVYLWDWSIIEDKGARVENFIASHLLKATQFWTDLGLGLFDLHFVRDKDKREVDFLITKNQKPWLLLEVKSSGKEPLNPNLNYFQEQLQAEHVLQVAFDLPYVEQDCFALKKPKIVPAITFLSQLV